MFTTLKKQVQEQFSKISKNSLYRVQVDRDKIWSVYLDSFEDELEKQEHNCNCCKSFLREHGGTVSLKNGEMASLWDFEAEGVYAKPVAALKKYIHSLSIDNIFFSENATAGTDKSPDAKRNVVWDHFHYKVPLNFVKKDSGSECSQARADKDVLKRSLEELSDSSIETVIELIDQNSLYRGAEYKAMVKNLQKVKEEYKKIKNNKTKDNFCWEKFREIGPAFSRVRNTAIGTLLIDLSKGEDLDAAVKSYERVVAPANYKRPTALVTPRMVEAAKERLNELGLIGALKRRQLSEVDLNVNNSLFVFRSQDKTMDVFEEIKKDSVVNPKTLSKVEEISISDFIKNVLPKAKSVSALVENNHFGNFVSLVGPQNENENTLFKWGNDYSFSYSGEVADSIKERVKKAGGKVDALLRISLSWHNYDDLDLHLTEPDRNEIYFCAKRSSSGGTLDVDMNAGFRQTREPVENIYFLTNPKKEGTFTVSVKNFSKREETNKGYEVEIEYDGEVYNFLSNTNGRHGETKVVAKFNYSKKEGFKINASSEISKYNSKEKWGIKSGQWQKVNAITLSPNYWNGEIGNKHFFFFLENCVSDERIRPFYNEFLREDLSQDRKVFEVLGSKIDVEKVPNELSGIGFSETMRNHLFVQVEGAFKRVLKINF